MPPTNWLVSNAEHCARATPECFEDNPSAIYVFMNGSRSFGGCVKLSPATLTWGDGVQQPVNACVDAIPPRLTDEDIGITQEQWARRAARHPSGSARRSARPAAQVVRAESGERALRPRARRMSAC
jgi:hypothetical protein